MVLDSPDSTTSCVKYVINFYIIFNQISSQAFSRTEAVKTTHMKQKQICIFSL